MASVDVGTADKKVKPGDNRLQCVVVTPERTLFDELVDFVALPLYDGELGVLPGRTPLIGRLGYGELRTKVDGVTRRYFVDGGFVKVRDAVVTDRAGKKAGSWKSGFTSHSCPAQAW